MFCLNNQHEIKMRNCDLLTYKNKDLMMAVISFIDRDPHKTLSSQRNYAFQLQKNMYFPHVFTINFKSNSKNTASTLRYAF